MLLGSSDFSTQIRADISSLRVLLLTLFFGAAGMIADPVWIYENLGIVSLVAVLLTVGKAVVIWAIFRLLGHSTRVAVATGLCLAQIGEFAFVLGSIGRSNEVVTADTYALVVSITIVSFFISAAIVPLAPNFGNYVARILGDNPDSGDASETMTKTPDVLIIGFGPAGRLAAQAFVDLGRPALVIDLNRKGAKQAKESGFDVLIGDATLPDVLEHVHLHQAKIVVITIPHHPSAITILELVRLHAPQAHIIVRSRYKLYTDDFVSSGAHVVVGDEEEVGAKIADEVKAFLLTH
jgi:CPA2 family monovalent cation:H+ antiporter-2